MNDQFVTYEIAKRLKELGFNDNCIGWFTENGLLKIYDYQIKVSSYTKAPLWQQAIDWLRVEHNISVCGPGPYTSSGESELKVNMGTIVFYYQISKGSALLITQFEVTAEQAREAAIIKALELISK